MNRATRRTWPLFGISARFGQLQQPLKGVAALHGGLALAQHHALQVVVDVERGSHRCSPYGSSTWPIVSWQRPICHPLLRIVIRILIMYGKPTVAVSL